MGGETINRELLGTATERYNAERFPQIFATNMGMKPASLRH